MLKNGGSYNSHRSCPVPGASSVVTITSFGANLRFNLELPCLLPLMTPGDVSLRKVSVVTMKPADVEDEAVIRSITKCANR